MQIPGAALSESVMKTRPPSELTISSITPNRFQPRTEVAPESLQSLVDSIKLHGVMEPILVRPSTGGKYELVVGQRRLLAAKMVGLKSIPAVVQEMSDEQVLVLSLVENLQREDLNPADEARAFQTLSSRFGLTHEAIGEAVSKGRTYITNSLRLLMLEKPALDALASGRLTRGQALALLACPQPSRAAALKQALGKGMTVRQIEEMAKAAPKPKVKAKPEKSAHLERVASELEQALGTRVRIEPKKKGGEVIIAYTSDADLNRIFRLLVNNENPY